MGLIDTDYLLRQPIGSKAITNLPLETLQEAVDEASDYVEDYLDRKVLETEYIERIPGQRNYTVILDNFPITDLIDVSWTDPFGGVGTMPTTDFLVHSEAGIIEMINKIDNFRGDRVYTFRYTAGYATVPTPIRRAVALQTIQLLQPMYGGLQQGGTDLVPFADEQITNLLERYRRKRLS